MVLKVQAVRESPCNEEAFMAKSSQKGLARGFERACLPRPLRRRWTMAGGYLLCRVDLDAYDGGLAGKTEGD